MSLFWNTGLIAPAILIGEKGLKPYIIFWRVLDHIHSKLLCRKSSEYHTGWFDLGNYSLWKSIILVREGDFRSLGWNVRKNYRGEIAISQKDYITDKVEKLSIQKPRHALLQTRLSEKEASILGSSIGCLRWLEDQTHPDCAIACLVLNTKQLAHVWPPGY